MSKIILWESVMEQILKIKGMKVHREEFLTNPFRNYGDISKINTRRPIDLFDENTIHEVAQGVIKKSSD